MLQTSSFLHPNACLQNQPDSRFRFGTPRAAVGLGLRFGHKVQLWRHQRFPLPAPQSLPRGSSSSRPGFIFEEEAVGGRTFYPQISHRCSGPVPSGHFEPSAPGAPFSWAHSASCRMIWAAASTSPELKERRVRCTRTCLPQEATPPAHGFFSFSRRAQEATELLTEDLLQVRRGLARRACVGLWPRVGTCPAVLPADTSKSRGWDAPACPRAAPGLARQLRDGAG